MSNKFHEKLKKVNSEKEEIIFKMEYKGRVVHDVKIEIPDYAKEIIDDEDTNFYYFFKDMANDLEELINELHKKKVWKKIDKEKKDGDENSK